MSKISSAANHEVAVAEIEKTTEIVEVFYEIHRFVIVQELKHNTLYPCPEPDFKPLSDVEHLQKMLLCDKIDEEKLCKILTTKSSPQRLEIVQKFKEQSGKDLIEILSEKLSGDLKTLIVALLTPPSEYLASELHYAIDGLGTDEKTLIEIICTADNYQIELIKASYKKLYEKTLEDDVKGDTSGSFQKLLVELLQGKRSESKEICEEEVEKDVSDLIAAMICPKSKSQLQEVVFKLLVNQSYVHLNAVFKKFHKIAQCHLQEVIKMKFSGDVRDTLSAIIKVIENRSHFFAERIRDSVAGWGTKDRQLIRLIVSRCEVDLKEIEEEYKKCYETCLEDDIADDTSGWYGKTLLCLVQYDH